MGSNPAVVIVVRCVYCVRSGISLRDELITRIKEPYRLLCVVVCDLETSRMRPRVGVEPQYHKKISDLKFTSRN